MLAHCRRKTIAARHQVKEGEMDIFRLIMADHARVTDLVRQLYNQTGSSGDRAQLFAQLKEEIELHAHAEEQVFYPLLQEREMTRELAFEALEDHHLVQELLADMATSSMESPAWQEKLDILTENVAEHMAEEESDLFEAARQVVTAAQADELAQRWHTAKQVQMARSAK
jgi:hemerythrin superfamily protein